MWPALLTAVVALAALAALQGFWRRRLRASETAAAARLAAAQSAHAEALAHERAQARALFDSMVEGFLLLDAEGRIRMLNPAFRELTGVSGACQGRLLLEVLRNHELAALAARATRDGRVLEQPLRLGGGVDRFVEVNAAALADPAGGQRGVILVLHDLTRLRRLEQTSSDFVANVSHELRTPLSMIKGYAETLLAGAKEDPELTTKFLQTIERHSNRLALLIEDLLTSSELQSGRAVMNFRVLPLRPLVEKVLEDFEGRARARGVALRNEMAELTVKADADRLQQVLGNLLDNAIKYGRPGGVVRLGARQRDDGAVEVRVQDDGPGLPAEAVDRVFERFYRVDKARSREQGGTGLGLSIVKDIILAHGGRVWAESQPGQGATFLFTLPANGAAPAVAGDR